MGANQGQGAFVNDVIELEEFSTKKLPREEFSNSDAELLYNRHNEKVSVEWPTPKTDYQWQLSAQGWAGYLPLKEARGISLQPKVPLQNLFQMLEYAYDLNSFQLLEGLFDCESIQDFYERLAVILASRFLVRTRQGLYKNYLEEYEDLSFVRGRIDLPVLSSRVVKIPLPCNFEEHTLNIAENQIVAWTLHLILQCGVCQEKATAKMRQAERVLRGAVLLKPFSGLDCVNRNYNRLNADYEVMHKLCRFFIENTGPTQHLGDTGMIPFLVNMSRLFESFVARWLIERLDIRLILKSQENIIIGEQGALKMIIDLVIYDRESNKPLCVLDTKYKAGKRISPVDYNQVVAYADALHCHSAFLIYPKLLEEPFDEQWGSIRVKTLCFDINDDLDLAGEQLLNRLYEVIDLSNVE